MADTVFLVVRDDELRCTLCELVDSMGVAVSAVRSGLNLRERASRGDPGVVVWDQRLPAVDAAAIAKQLQSEGGWLPLVVLVDACQPATVEAAHAAGAWAVVALDVAHETLWRIILAALVFDRDGWNSSQHREKLYGWLSRQFDMIAAESISCAGAP